MPETESASNVRADFLRLQKRAVCPVEDVVGAIIHNTRRTVTGILTAFTDSFGDGRTPAIQTGGNLIERLRFPARFLLTRRARRFQDGILSASSAPPHETLSYPSSWQPPDGLQSFGTLQIQGCNLIHDVLRAAVDDFFSAIGGLQSGAEVRSRANDLGFRHV